MSISMMSLAWKSGYPAGQKMVLLALCDNANDQGECYPAIQTIAKKCSMSERSVFNHIDALEKDGALYRENRLGRSTMYHIDPCKFCTPTPATVAPLPLQILHPPLQPLHPPPANSAPITIIEPSHNHQRTKDSTSPAKLPTCPTQSLIDIYHEVLPTLPTCRLMPKKREAALCKAWVWVLTSTRPDKTRRAETEEQALGWFREYFKRATENDFLMGRTPRSAAHAGWKCDLDYLLTDSGMKQVIEKTGATA